MDGLSLATFLVQATLLGCLFGWSNVSWALALMVGVIGISLNVAYKQHPAAFLGLFRWWWKGPHHQESRSQGVSTFKASACVTLLISHSPKHGQVQIQRLEGQTPSLHGDFRKFTLQGAMHIRPGSICGYFCILMKIEVTPGLSSFLSKYLLSEYFIKRASVFLLFT